MGDRWFNVLLAIDDNRFVGARRVENDTFKRSLLCFVVINALIVQRNKSITRLVPPSATIVSFAAY